jgi:hypothetical protein
LDYQKRFVGGYRREAIQFIIMLEKRLIWYTDHTRGYWIYHKDRLVNKLAREEHHYSKEQLILNLHRLGDISEKYKAQNNITLGSLEFDRYGEVSNNVFLKRVDRLKSLMWEIMEVQYPNLYKN